MNKLIFALPLIFVVFLAGCVSSQTKETTKPVVPTGVEHVVDITGAGFNPTTLTINLGDTLTFINKDTEAHWPASDVHPTHNLYPEKGGCIGSKFDACRGLAQGEKYEFTFLYPGHWCFHDHLKPSSTGCVDVQ